MIALMPGFYAKKQHVLDVAEKKNHAHEAKKRAAALDAALGGHAGMVYAPEYDLNLVDTKKWAVQRLYLTDSGHYVLPCDDFSQGTSSAPTARLLPRLLARAEPIRRRDW